MDFEGWHHSERNLIDDPWFGRTHTDVTDSHYRPVPSHCSQDVTAPVPSYDRRCTDVTEQLHSRRSSPMRDYNYGKVNTDVTRYLHGKAPKFVDPRGGELEPYFGVQGTDITNYKVCPIQSKEGPNLTEFMHPLGKHRPFPLTQMFYHDELRPRSRSASPHKCREPSPPRPPRQQHFPAAGGRTSPSKHRESPYTSPSNGYEGPCTATMTSPSKGYELPCTSISSPPPLPRNRSCSPPAEDGHRSRSPTKSHKPRHGHRSSPSPRRPPPASNHQEQSGIPSPFLNCGRACQLCPPCPACQELLNSSYGKELSTAAHGRGGGRNHCQFHGNAPCPVQAGLPCYGMRPWGGQ